MVTINNNSELRRSIAQFESHARSYRFFRDVYSNTLFLDQSDASVSRHLAMTKATYEQILVQLQEVRRGIGSYITSISAQHQTLLREGHEENKRFSEWDARRMRSVEDRLDGMLCGLQRKLVSAVVNHDVDIYSDDFLLRAKELLGPSLPRSFAVSLNSEWNSHSGLMVEMERKNKERDVKCSHLQAEIEYVHVEIGRIEAANLIGSVERLGDDLEREVVDHKMTIDVDETHDLCRMDWEGT